AGAARLDHGWESGAEPAAVPAPGFSTLSLLAIGVSALILGFSILAAGNYVAEQFARAAWLGWLTLLVALGGFGTIFWAVMREFRALMTLREV
ncbi:hypothetical protein ACXWSV_09045, partial [Streptococcus pyogenes]